jgi:hypothetical protein
LRAIFGPQQATIQPLKFNLLKSSLFFAGKKQLSIFAALPTGEVPERPKGTVC